MKKILVLSLIMLTLTLGCKKDDDISIEPIEQEEEENSGTTTFKEVEISVLLPDNSNFNLGQAKVFSLGETFNIAGNGTSKAINTNDTYVLAAVLDNNDNIVLTGFISDEKKEISIRSTVEASLLFALGAVFQPEEIKQLYFNGIGTEINIDDLVSSSETLFKSDSNFAVSETYNSLIADFAQKKLAGSKPIDIKSSKGITASNIERSGVTLLKEPGNNIVFENDLRRRGHVYLYKTKTINESGEETILINDIASENSVAVNDVIVPPVAGFTSIIGGLIDVVSGKGAEFLSKKSDPTALILNDSELQAIYKARLIGPRIVGDKNALTDTEADRLFRLNLETFSLDILAPILSQLIGSSSDRIKNIDKTKLDKFTNILNGLVSTIDPLNDAIKEGDFNKAKDEFFTNFFKGTSGSIFESLFREFADLALLTLDGSSAEASGKILKATENLFAPLKLAEKGLAAIDLIRVVGTIVTSNSLEEWEINVSRSPVSLTPKESSTTINDDGVTLTATVEDMELASGQFFEYVWTSSGNFGTITDDNTGNSDAITLTTTNNKITYTVEEMGEGEEEIKVNVFLREGNTRTEVNDATAVIQVLPFKFVLKPNNATIKGGETLALYVEDEDGNSIKQSARFQYAIVWETSGLYGKFNGTRNSITEIDNNRILYESLETEEDVFEDITANIYRREEISENFKFVDELTTTVEINNDPNVKIFYVNVTKEIGVPNAERVARGSGLFYGALFLQPQIERGIKYRITIIDYKHPNRPDGGKSFIGKTAEFNVPQDPPNHPIRVGVEKTMYGIQTASAGISDLPNFAELRAQQAASINAITGRAQVIVTLSPEN